MWDTPDKHYKAEHSALKTCIEASFANAQRIEGKQRRQGGEQKINN
jgi:hypothetical protein